MKSLVLIGGKLGKSGFVTEINLWGDTLGNIEQDVLKRHSIYDDSWIQWIPLEGCMWGRYVLWGWICCCVYMVDMWRRRRMAPIKGYPSNRLPCKSTWKANQIIRSQQINNDQYQNTTITISASIADTNQLMIFCGSPIYMYACFIFTKFASTPYNTSP